MSIKCAEDPFNMGMFFDIRPPSLWVHFQTPNTHIRAFCTGVAPPGSHPSTRSACTHTVALPAAGWEEGWRGACTQMYSSYSL